MPLPMNISERYFIYLCFNRFFYILVLIQAIIYIVPLLRVSIFRNFQHPGIFHCFFPFCLWNSIKTFTTPLEFFSTFSSIPWNSIKILSPGISSFFFLSPPGNFKIQAPCNYVILNRVVRTFCIKSWFKSNYPYYALEVSISRAK